MPYRSVKEIEMELAEVAGIITSKELALKIHPNDFGLELELMEFENIQEDLIRELSKVKNEPKKYTQHIKNRLTKTQLILSKKRDEHILRPDKNELKDDIELLELMENGLATELERCYLNQNLSVFEMRFSGKTLKDFRIPLQQLGELLVKFHEVPSAIAKSIYYQKKRTYIENEDVQISLQNVKIESEEKQDSVIKTKKKEKLSKFLDYNSQFYATAITSGSVRIILTSPQPVIDNEIINDTFKTFKEIVECGDNKEALQKETEKIGAIEPIIKYKNFLKPLYGHNIDIELSRKNKKLENIEMFKLSHKKARDIYKVLNKPDEPITHSIIRIGILIAVDLETRTFKFHLDDENRTISGKFNEELDSTMKNKTFNETYKVGLSELIPSTNLKKQTTRYRLLKFLDE